ncbi:RhtX/FptX family siderophore transporter [Novosphingobium sp. ZW T3_23]|uniref:RhtX/FptX family siderophore transporter n=1 Tax=Novosphingobium sp. ZW T3_23 TaxID=3378084 RepID=UPI00385240D2
MPFMPLSRDLRLLCVIGLLYITQGIPMGLAMEALPTLLRRDGAPLSALAFLPLVGIPWIIKFLWAPWVDNHWSPRLGKRRSWILPMQGVIVACLLAAALVGFEAAGSRIAIALFTLASLASATQDTATDGLAVENFSGPMLARANAVQVGGTMVGFFLGGGGFLIISGLFGRTVGMVGLAGIVAMALLLAALWHEPQAPREQARESASLKRFLRRRGAFRILALALLVAMSASATFGLFKLLLVDRGWSMEAIGLVGTTGGAVTILIGCGGGAWLLNRVGLRSLLTAAGVCLVVSAATWALIGSGVIALSMPLVLVAVVAGSIGSGAGSVGAMTWAMHFASQSHQAGTDMTAVQSMRDAGEIGAGVAGTALAASLGYGIAFAMPVFLALSLVLVVFTRSNDNRDVPPPRSK